MSRVPSGWWLTYPSEKYESQWKGLSHILWKIKNVPNHQPAMIFVYHVCCSLFPFSVRTKTNFSRSQLQSSPSSYRTHLILLDKQKTWVAAGRVWKWCITTVKWQVLPFLAIKWYSHPPDVGVPPKMFRYQTHPAYLLISVMEGVRLFAQCHQRAGRTTVSPSSTTTL